MRRRGTTEAGRVFRAGGASGTGGDIWEKLESVNRTGERGGGRKRNVQEALGWIVMRGQGRSRLSLQDRMVRPVGPGTPRWAPQDFRWAPPEA